MGNCAGQMPPISLGTNVAILLSHFGFWSLKAARIAYLVDDHGSREKYAFAYTGSTWSGEERFTVEFHSEDGSVWYDCSRSHGQTWQLGWGIL